MKSEMRMTNDKRIPNDEYRRAKWESLSLAPGFSGSGGAETVLTVSPALAKTVETLFNSHDRAITPLKRGANERRPLELNGAWGMPSPVPRHAALGLRTSFGIRNSEFGFGRTREHTDG